MRLSLRSNICFAISAAIVFTVLPFKAAADSQQAQKSGLSHEFEPTPPVVTFRIKSYKISNEKGFALCTNFASVVQKHSVPVIVDKNQFETSIQEASKQKTLKLYSSPSLKSLVGMPAWSSIGSTKDQFTVRALANMVEGRVNYRFMASNLVFKTDDKTNPFWSDNHDGPFELNPGQTVAIYNNGGNGRPGILTTFEAVLESSQTKKP